MTLRALVFRFVGDTVTESNETMRKTVCTTQGQPRPNMAVPVHIITDMMREEEKRDEYF